MVVVVGTPGMATQELDIQDKADKNMADNPAQACMYPSSNANTGSV